MKDILVGCDPELFVTNDDGNPRSAWGLIPGTKTSPYKVPKGAVQVDGMALEFNIDPAKDEEEFVDNIRTVMTEMRKMVPDKFNFHIEPSVAFNGNHLRAQPKEAKELGCEPDFNAYTLKENPKPNSATTLRTASGHVHIGLLEGADVTKEDHHIWCATLVKHLDLWLGLRSLEWDKDQTRRRLYGNPGAYRPKPYGLEYRVLSNAWLKDEKYTRFVYKQVKACIEDLKKNGALKPKQYEMIAQDIKNGYQYYSKSPYYVDQKRFSEALKLKIDSNVVNVL